MFKLVRMENLEVTEMKNTRDHDPSDFQPKDSDESALRIRLYGKASIKAKCGEYLNGQVTREYENGDFEFCFAVPAHETFWYGVLLSFGNRVKVIEPQALVERILESCREIQLVYKE